MSAKSFKLWLRDCLGGLPGLIALDVYGNGRTGTTRTPAGILTIAVYSAAFPHTGGAALGKIDLAVAIAPDLGCAL